MPKKYVVVGFRVDVENSIWYRKFEQKRTLLKFLNDHLDEVDFVSLRVVKVRNEKDRSLEVIDNE